MDLVIATAGLAGTAPLKRLIDWAQDLSIAVGKKGTNKSRSLVVIMIEEFFLRKILQ
jgi:hypothetical protein